MITLIGLGVESGDLSFNALEALKSASKVFLRTELVNSAKILKDENVSYISFDSYYEKSKNFNTLSKKIYSTLLKESKQGDICYCVEGDVTEDKVCAKLISKKKCKNCCFCEKI